MPWPSWGGEDLHEGIHMARKRCTKIRSVLRLVRPACKDTYRAENAWYRDTARLLSDVRDAAAVIETFDSQIGAPYGEQLQDRLLETARAGLVDRREQMVGDGDLHERVAEVADRLRAGHERAARWELDAHGWDAVGPGIAKTYARARRRMHEARDGAGTNLLHEWRKRAKYHRHHARLLAGMWPQEMEARRSAAEELTDLLGDDHDLAVLRRVLLEEELLETAADGQALSGIIDARRSDLQAAARAVGRRLLAEPADHLVRRLGAYWEAWRDGDRPAA